MYLASNNIDRKFNSEFPIFKLLVLGGVAAFFSFLSVRLKNRAVKRVTRVLCKTDKQLKATLIRAKSKEYTLERSKKLHTNIKGIITKFNSFYIKLEKVDFFTNQQMKKAADSIALTLYSLEGHFRMIAYAEQPPIPEDKNLIEAASAISLGSLHA